MSDADLKLLADGPAGYWSDAKEPTLAQYRAMAINACAILGVEPPKTRREATLVLARFMILGDEVKVEVPPPW